MEKKVIQAVNKYNSSQVEKLKEIGAYLQQKRLEQSLSLEEIASSTFIRLPILQALEDGEVALLPERIYVQGFIRRYSQVLKVDGQALAKSLSSNEGEIQSQNISPEIFFLRQKVSPTPQKETPSSQQIEPPPQFITDSPQKVTPEPQESFSAPVFPHLTGLSRYVIYLLLLIGAIGGLFYILSHSSTPETEVNLKPSTQSKPVVKASPVSPSPKPSVSPSPEVKASPLPLTTPKANSPVSVTVNLEDSSWLRIQADGKTIYEGILTKGTQKTWTAEKQLTVRSGNAGAVNLSLNQAPSQLLGKPGEVKEVTLTPNN